jgi:predicted RNA-binding protein YlxR (DUF448 family)
MKQMLPSTPTTADEAPRPVSLKDKRRERRCVASGEAMEEARLVRFALGPDDVIVPDVAAKVPGRGVWVEATRAAVETARKKGGFARSLKQAVKVPEDLADQTERLLSRRCLDQLGLMRKAGAMAFGQTKVEAAIRNFPVWALIEANDGAREGREKLAALYIGLWRRLPPVAACFSSTELAMALGREHVIHACLLQERMARAWAAEIGRLSGFRAIVPDSWPSSWRSLGLGLSDAAPGPSGPGPAPSEPAFDDAAT